MISGTDSLGQNEYKVEVASMSNSSIRVASSSDSDVKEATSSFADRRVATYSFASKREAANKFQMDPDNENIYKIPYSLENGMTEEEIQLFQNGVMIHEARWPNMEPDASLMAPTLATMGTGTTYSGEQAVVVDENLPDIDYTNVKLWTPGGKAWTSWTTKVKGYNAEKSSVSIELAKILSNANYGPTPGNQYYIYGTKSLLDADGEWWYDASAKGLYVYSSNGTPEGIEIKNRKMGFDFSNRSYIQVEDIDLFGCTVMTNSSSSNIVLDGMNAMYLSHRNTYGNGSDTPPPAGRGIELSGENNILMNSTLQYSSNGSLAMIGSGHQVFNCSIRDSGYQGSYAGAVILEGSELVVSHNTITNSGRTAISNIKEKTLKNCLIQYNDISDAGVLTADTAGIYLVNVDGAGTEIRYNKVHDIECHLGMGIYLDNYTSNFLVHHNVVWNTVSNSFHLNIPSNNNLVFNNTGVKSSSREMTQFGMAFTQDVTGDKFYNNMISIGKGATFYAEEKMNIWNASLDLFVDVENNDFRLNEDSPAIDSALIISGITDDFDGDAPDVGAYEYGTEGFEAGCNFLEIPDANYDRILTGYENWVENGTFTEDEKNWAVSGTVKSVVTGTWGNSDALARNQGRGLSIGGQGSIKQTVTGLEPNTTYELNGWFKHSADGGDTVMSVSDYGNDTLEVKAEQKKWSQKSVLFTTGADDTTAVISIENKSGGDGDQGGEKISTEPLLSGLTNFVGSTSYSIPLNEAVVNYVSAQRAKDKNVSFKLDGTGNKIQLYIRKTDPMSLKVKTEVKEYVIPLSKSACVAKKPGDSVGVPGSHVEVSAGRNSYLMFDLSSINASEVIKDISLDFKTNYVANPGAAGVNFTINSYDFDDWTAAGMTWENQDYPVIVPTTVYVDDISVFRPYQVTDSSALAESILYAQSRLKLAGELIGTEVKDSFKEEINQASKIEDKTEAKLWLDQRTGIFVERLELEKTIISAIKTVEETIEDMDSERWEGPKRMFDQAIEDAKAMLNRLQATASEVGETKQAVSEAVAAFISGIMPKISSYHTANMQSILEDVTNWNKSGGEIKDNQNGSFTFTPGKVYEYVGETYGDTMIEFDFTYGPAGGYPGFVLRAQSETPSYAGDNYFFIFKPDKFEAQKYAAGSLVSLREFPNGTAENRLLKPGITQKIQIGAMNTEIGTRLFMYVDGQAAFDFIDSDKTVLPAGYFAVAPTGLSAAADFTVAPASAWIVDFDSCGGNNLQSLLVKKGEKPLMPNEPEREGYVFGGWYLDMKLTEEFHVDQPVEKNLTLYAAWTKETPEVPETPEPPVKPEYESNDDDASNSSQDFTWQKNADGTWKLLGKDGTVCKGWANVNGTWYYLAQDGTMKSNEWYKDMDGRWYYLTSSGAMANEVWIMGNDGIWYFVALNGAMATNQWILGKDKNWYYVNADGVMLINTTTPDNYMVGQDGAWIK